MAPRILLIDDDVELSRMLAEYLGEAGFEVDARGTVADGLAFLASAAGIYDLLILDVMLPDGDGLDLCRRIRAGEAGDAAAALPILMLTARGDETDRIVGLELGADDYLPKPFNPRELLARLRAVLRRGRVEPGGDKIERFGRLEIDHGARKVRIEGEDRELTSHQFALLCVLSDQPGRVLSRDAIMARLAGRDLEAFDRSIDVHISRIRAAIEDDPRKPRRILTVRGTGYVFASKQDEPGL
ncbi:MAG: response regulator transcription factor [Deltaproteobacteria bacterium]|nr:response regulator transcription factor [Deltaproteobacteria bacterium]MBW2394365.1 response regulator transcription factor [Deltaproteobacteria bacterium]